MLDAKDEEGQGSGRRAYLRSVSWSDRSPNKPDPCYPRAQPSTKARSCLPPLQPLSISKRNVEEWPKAGSDDLGVWPQPTTPGGGRIGCGGTGVKSNESLKIEVPGREFESNKDKLAFYEKECSRIVDHIYLGSEAIAKNREVLRQNGITHVLNCVGFICPEFFKGDLVYKTLWLQDSPSEDITSILYDVFDYFEDVREHGGRVLVHCSQGVSRSTSLVIAYLMWKDGRSFEDAFQYVKAARGVTNPNMGFACQLLQCQKRVHAIPASPNSVLRMYRMAPHSPYDPLHLVPKMLCSPGKQGLDSRGAFVVHIPSSIYVWIGKFCSSVMSNNARVAAQQVIRYEKAKGPISIIKEGEEPSEFWDALCREELLKDSSDSSLNVEGRCTVNDYVGGRKVDVYDMDFEIFQKALSGGVVPPFTSSGSLSETRLPMRENGWDRLRRKFATGFVKEFLSSPMATAQPDYESEDIIDALHVSEEPVSPTAHLMESAPRSALSTYIYPDSDDTCSAQPSPCSSPDSFSQYPHSSPTFNQSPSLSPSTSEYSNPFTFSPSSSNWSDLSNLSSQPSPSGSDFPDQLCPRIPASLATDSDRELQNAASRSCADAFAATSCWKSSICSPCKGVSPSIAERRGSSPPTLELEPLPETARVPRPLVRSWSFSLPEWGDETMTDVSDWELKLEDCTKVNRDELLPDAEN